MFVHFECVLGVAGWEQEVISLFGDALLLLPVQLTGYFLPEYGFYSDTIPQD